MKRFFNFERMITPVIIKILFWIGLIASAIGGIAVFITTLSSSFSGGKFPAVILSFFLGLLGGILTFALGVLISRIYAELLILVFQINETLTDIKVLLEKNNPEE
jgi:hypothetical protein